MNKKIFPVLALLTSFLLAFTTFILPSTASPSGNVQAQVQLKRAVFTDVTHASDDSGYAAPIRITCRNDGSTRYLYTGESSVWGNKACGGLGVDKIVIGADQAVRCFNALPPYQSLYYLRTAEVPSYASLKCYMQRPI